jgi:hypothetical protein
MKAIIIFYDDELFDRVVPRLVTPFEVSQLRGPGMLFDLLLRQFLRYDPRIKTFMAQLDDPTELRNSDGEHIVDYDLLHSIFNDEEEEPNGSHA